MLRAVIVTLSVSLLCRGGAAAKPGPLEKPAPAPTKKPPALDPVWAKQVASQLRGQPEAQTRPLEAPPNFAAIKRMTVVQRVTALQAQAPEQVKGPLRFSAQKNYYDEHHHLELYSFAGRVSLRTSMDYAFLSGPPEAFVNQYDRPMAVIRFLAETGRRYLLECAVDVPGGGPPATISARSGGTVYSVSTTEKATLLFLHDAAAAAESAEVAVSITGDRPWNLD